VRRAADVVLEGRNISQVLEPILAEPQS